MPSASAKLEKQASTESTDSIKQGITIIEHKIRNLEKRKARLETYRDQQSSGKELNSDQLAAIAKYDEVQQTLEFARELCKQFHGIAAESAKQQKKQARKEALERAQQELSKVKEILLIQDVLANMGQDNVREDFLAGRSGAVKLTEEDLQHLDDLFTEVSPKRDVEEGGPPFSEQLQKAAEHLLFLTEGKNKEVIGTTYILLRQKIQEINTCSYFDSSSTTAAASDTVVEAPAGSAPEEEEDVEAEEEEPDSVPSTTFQPSKATVPMAPPVLADSSELAQGPTKAIIPPPQPPASEVISSVMSAASSSFHFLQDSELDSPEVVAPTAPPPSALPIPSQTFTNQSFVAPPPQSYPQQPQSLPQNQQPQAVYATIPIPGQQSTYVPYTSTAPPQPHQPAYQQQQVQPQQQQPPQAIERVSDWSDTPTSGNVIECSDWNTQCEAASADANAWQQPKSDNWALNDTGSRHQGNNDGFIMTSSSRGSGGRGGRGGRGGSRGSRGSGRGGSGGGGGSGGFYRNNSNTSGGDNSSNNYYQSNGYQNRNMSGDHKRGGGLRSGPPGGPRSDRGGPRGGGNRGGRGSNRQ